MKTNIYGTEEIELKCVERHCDSALDILGDAFRLEFEPRELALWQWKQNWGREVLMHHVHPDQLEEEELLSQGPS